MASKNLGVLLYELLTSRTPFEINRLLEEGLDGIRRIIREEEPARPSTKLHTLDAAVRVSLRDICTNYKYQGLTPA